MAFISFLTFVVDIMFLERNTSAIYPLMTRKSHMKKYGAPDNTPFYNVSTVDYATKISISVTASCYCQQ